MINIQPQYLSFSKLLDHRLFSIPEYQRSYSWKSKQRQDLFADLKKTVVKGSEEGHFMAAIVCLRRGTRLLGTDDFQSVEVVDGQQRLTTLIVLFKTMALGLDPLVKAESKLRDEINDLLVKPDSEELLLLQTNHDSSHHFSGYLRRGIVAESSSATTIADREILMAVEECTIFIKAWREKFGELLSLAALLKNRLFFLLHEIDQEKAVYTVFEVLNSRGLEVSWLDRLKSILMGAAFELPKGGSPGLIDELHRIWRDTYAVIGLRQGLSTEALRFAATLRAGEAPSRPLGEQDAVDSLRARLTTAKSIREVGEWILSVATACDVVVNNLRINAVTRISQARLLAVAIHIRTDLSKKQKQTLLDSWEKVTFRIYGMLGNDARTKVGDYVRLAWSIVNEKLDFAQIQSGISAIGKAFPIEKAIDGLWNQNCYEGWEQELRYFMFRYEEHLVATKRRNFSNEEWNKIWMANASESIEHIWAKSKAPEKAKHRLGNLVLLPPRLNSRLQDLPASHKIDAYSETGLLIAREVSATIAESGWTTATIEAREQRLVAWAKKEWSD